MMRYMAAKICKIKNYEVKSGCSYFFDNNVWMLLFAKIAGAYEDRQKNIPVSSMTLRIEMELFL